MSAPNESVIDVCDACGGDGGFDEPTSLNLVDGSVNFTWHKCGACDGQGFVVRDAEEAGDEWITDQVDEVKP